MLSNFDRCDGFKRKHHWPGYALLGFPIKQDVVEGETLQNNTWTGKTEVLNVPYTLKDVPLKILLEH